jgi:murein DD-endopeptidase MepM/ murein hydrolase activator NlpD
MRMSWSACAALSVTVLAILPGTSLAQSTDPPPDPASDPGTGDLEAHEYGSRRMKSGASGTDVANLQEYLTTLGLDTPVTGYFGDITRGNVELWEAWRYRRADGEVPSGQAGAIRRDVNDGLTYERRKHVFTVRGPHNFGGPGSRFGAPRSGHTHKGQDIAAAHGTKLVAVHDGTVSHRQYQAGGAGYYVVIRGDDGSDSVYMHMPGPAKVAPGEDVLAGEKIGKVGCTGSCTGPHLHFELWTPHWFAGGHAYDPLPKLLRWDERT